MACIGLTGYDNDHWQIERLECIDSLWLVLLQGVGGNCYEPGHGPEEGVFEGDFSQASFYYAVFSVSNNPLFVTEECLVPVSG